MAETTVLFSLSISGGQTTVKYMLENMDAKGWHPFLSGSGIYSPRWGKGHTQWSLHLNRWDVVLWSGEYEQMLRYYLKKACNSWAELHHRCLWHTFKLPQEVQTLLLLLRRHEMMGEMRENDWEMMQAWFKLALPACVSVYRNICANH